VKRRLCDLDRGTLFRTADGLLWRPGYPATGATRWAHAVGRPQDSRGLPADAEVEVLDPAAVLARAALLERENAELRAVLHDLWQDRDGAAAGAAAERGAIIEALGGLLPVRQIDLPQHPASVVWAAIDRVKARGPARPPVPPCALEGVVREAVTLLAPYYESGVDKPFVGEVKALLARLRAALGEANG
jgi:hypothetical protein